MFEKKHPALLLILLFFMPHQACFSIPSLDSLQNILDSLITTRDSINRELLQQRKEERQEKVQKAFIFMSYINYSDRGNGTNFRGVEAYQAYAGKTIRSIDVKIFKPFGCAEDSC